jgi:hypothetical protein
MSRVIRFASLVSASRQNWLDPASAKCPPLLQGLGWPPPSAFHRRSLEQDGQQYQHSYLKS